MKKVTDYGNIAFSSIYGKFKLTDKYFADTNATYGRYSNMAQEWQDLMRFDRFFMQTHSDNSDHWFASIRLHLPGKKSGKRYPFRIICNDRTGLLKRIIIYDVPQYRGSEERRNKIIKAVKECVGYFIAVMIHHGYIEKVKDNMNTFYMLVAGSRTYNNYTEMRQVLDFLLQNQIAQNRKIVIVSGGARGADELAEKYAYERGYKKHIIPANWNLYGKSAGYRRNEEMHKFIANPSDNNRGCVCFWDMQSRGTKHNFKLADDYNTPIRVYDTVNHRFLSDEEVRQYA